MAVCPTPVSPSGSMERSVWQDLWPQRHSRVRMLALPLPLGMKGRADAAVESRVCGQGGWRKVPYRRRRRRQLGQQRRLDSAVRSGSARDARGAARAVGLVLLGYDWGTTRVLLGYY